MPSNERNLIGSVVERRTPSSLTGTTSLKFASTPGTGFPAVQHRSKSSFARGREEAKGKGRLNQVPSVGLPKVAPPTPEIKPIPANVEDLQRQISEENEKRVASMTSEEIEKGRQEILEQLGSGTSDLLKRVHEARLRKFAQEQAVRDTEKPAEEVGSSDSKNGQLFIIAHPKPTLPSLGARPGILRVKSLENIPQTGKAF